MAGLRYSFQSGEIATGVARRTMLQVTAPANQRIKVKEWSISYDGVVQTNPGIFVEIERQTSAGLGGDVITGKKLDDDIAETVQSTGLELIDGTTAPTPGDVLMSEQVHPQGGYTWRAAFGEEIIVKGGERLGIIVTASVDVNAVVRMICEE